MKILKKRDKLQNRTENKINAERKINNIANQSIEETFLELNSKLEGISDDFADNYIEEFGENIISYDLENTTAHRLKESIVNPFNMVLLVIAAITFLTDVVFSTKPDYLTIGIILLLVTVSSLVAFIQSERSNKAAEKLSKMISNKTDVIRNGIMKEIDISKVVCGDIIKLSAGDMIPADVKFITTKDLFISQSELTGESNPIEKFSDFKDCENLSTTDYSNIGFMGTNVVSGSALAIAFAKGNETYFGSMAKSITNEKAKNSFERGVDSVSKLLISLMVIVIPIVFLINGITKGDWLNSLIFAITIAVGLTPEMLPVIMTSTLAKGAINMSKHKVIVKSLGAIQSFGEMDILCTDKTGTLTEDKIILEKYMNVLGNDDKRILRHAYLNSFFQTGLKNLIDLAIINRAVEDGLEKILEDYKCIDEIPFDFSRRCMSVVLEDKQGKSQLITKGAVEEIIDRCSFVELDGKILPMSDTNKEKAIEVYENYNHDGLRMLAVAQKNDINDIKTFSKDDEKNMVLIGFVGFLDPPKESAKSAIEALRENGVRTVVLTGDSEGVALKVCSKVGIKADICFTGFDVEKMDDSELLDATNKCDIFAKLSPNQKQRIVKIFQINGHTVGYMGDGINDAPPLHQSDVGISVDSAVDIAKETANIVLLEKDLMVLEEGVLEGRRTFGNIIKYIKMAASGNFGNMISVIVASLFLPFLPMLPIQILTQNLLCDFSQMGIPFDNVDKEYIRKPRKWETKSIKSFMAVLGPVSSVFDILCFAVMWWVVKANTESLSPLFQCGWFFFGTISQVLVIHMIRTAKIPFIQSSPSIALFISTFAIIILTTIIVLTNLSTAFDMIKLPLNSIPLLVTIVILYCLSIQVIKSLYVKKYGEWL